jgi:hypothetical protein
MEKSAIKRIRQSKPTRIWHTCVILSSAGKYGILWRVVLGHFWRAK